MQEQASESRPAWLKGATRPADAFGMLLKHLRKDFKEASQANKISEFRAGIGAIQRHVGELSVADEFLATLPGKQEEDVVVFVGKRGPKGTPLIAFDATGRIWTGSVQASLGITPDERVVFNPFRANRHC